MGGVISGVTNLLTGGGGNAGSTAQADAAANSNYLLQQNFNAVQKGAQPYIDAGSSAVNQLNNGMSQFNQPFSMSQFQQSPGYQFSLQQGQQAIQNSGAAQGGLVSGAEMAALNNYSQNTANNEYQNAFNNYQTQQSNSYSRLAGLANIGQSANSGLGGMMMQTGNQMGQNMQGAANAYAANQMNQTNQTMSLAGLGMAGYLAFCDIRVKKNIEAISKEDLSELKSSIKAYKFNYKDVGHGEGDWIGVMAQDLLKSKLGRTLVRKGSDGLLKVDLKKAMTLFLASMAEA